MTSVKAFRLIAENRFAALLLILTLRLFPLPRDNVTLDTALGSALLIAAAYSIGRTRRHVWILCALVTPVFIFFSLPVGFEPVVWQYLALGSGLSFLGYISALTLYQVLTAPQVDRDVLLGGVAVYLLIGILFGLAYTLVELHAPGSFAGIHGDSSGGTFRYFSFVTLTTLGYGDIVPASRFAQDLAVFEGLLGQLYIAVFIGRLVGVKFSEES